MSCCSDVMKPIDASSCCTPQDTAAHAARAMRVSGCGCAPVVEDTNTRKLVGVGVFAGISSGAALAGAAKVASRIESGVIVFIVCDGGWKYLSTGAWTDDLETVAERVERVIYF